MNEVTRTEADAWLLSRRGIQVDCSARQLPLTTPDVLWLVASGTLDLFAAAGGGRGRWHFLGRLGPGTIVPPLPIGPRYGLVGRPGPGCAVQMLDVLDIRRCAAREWVDDRVLAGYSAEEEALARGMDAGLAVLAGAVRGDAAPAGGERVDVGPGSWVEVDGDGSAGPGDGLVWIEVVHGAVSLWDETVDAGNIVPVVAPDRLRADGYSVLTGRTTLDLVADGTLWERLTAFQSGFWRALDRRITDGEHRDRERLAAARRAGAGVFVDAVRILRRQVDPDAAGTYDAEPDEVPWWSADGRHHDDAFVTVIRQVAEAAGITFRYTADATGRGEDAVERITRVAGLRSRAVQLSDDWWRHDAGPLVGRRHATGAPVALVWRDGGYEAVDPGGGDRFRVTSRTVGSIAPTAVMLYRPLPDRATSAVALLRYALRGARSDVLRLVAGGVAAVVLGLAVPVVTGQVLGGFVPDGQRGLIVQMCAAVAVASLVSMAFAMVENLALLRLEGRFEAALQTGIWDRLLRQPVAFFTRYSTGELAGRALSVSAIRATLSGVAAVAVHAALLGAVNFALQLWYSVPLAMLSAGLVLVDAVVFLAIGARQLVWQRKLVELENALTNNAFQTLQGLPKLRVAGAEGYAYADWAADFTRSQDLHRRIRRLQGAVTVFNAAYLPLSTLVLFWALSGPAAGTLSMSGFLTFMVAFSVQLTAMSQLTGAITSAGAAVPLLAQLKPILRQPPEVSATSRPPGELSGLIEASDLTFRYLDDGPPVLDRVSLRIEPGEFVAVVGTTGCGKSTLLRLLIGFEQPTSGSIRYDGQDLSTLDVAAVRRQCGVVLQQAQPFSGSIRDNICGAERFPIAQVWEAAELAGLADDIRAMPMGLHTVLTGNGGTLSAGQRQRLMIAQALIRRPRILFFDEATSALDNETQRIVTESTRALNATRIVIAHRLSTILQADRVVTLDGGQVVQCGRPSELLADQDGLFYQLVRRQIGGGSRPRKITP